MDVNNIIKYIKTFHKDEIDYISKKLNFLNKDILNEYLNNLSSDSDFKYIEAYNQQEKCIGGLCYQICTGPLPGIPDFFECGSIWGLWGDNSSLEKLLLISISDLRTKKVFKILTYVYNENIYEVLKT